jgi:hypothetical protein
MSEAEWEYAARGGMILSILPDHADHGIGAFQRHDYT